MRHRLNHRRRRRSSGGRLMRNVMLACVATTAVAGGLAPAAGQSLDPAQWQPEDGQRASVEAGALRFEQDTPAHWQALPLEDVEEVRLRFAVEDPPLAGWQVGLEGAGTRYAVGLGADGMFRWIADPPHYAGPRWSADGVYEVRWELQGDELQTTIVPPDGVPQSSGHVAQYRGAIPDAWRATPPRLTVGGGSGPGAVRLMAVNVYRTGDARPAGLPKIDGTIESALAKYQQFQRGELTAALAQEVEDRQREARPFAHEPRFEVQAWDGQKLRDRLRDADGVDDVARRYTLIQMRGVPDETIQQRMAEHDLGFAYYQHSREARYLELLSDSPHVQTEADVAGDIRTRFNVFNGDWIELAAVANLREVSGVANAGLLRQVMVDSEYRTGVGEDPLSTAARQAALGNLAEPAPLPDEPYTRIIDDNDPQWQQRLWAARAGMPNVTIRTTAQAMRAVWPDLPVTTDPIDDRADLVQFEDLDLVQHWVRVHWAPRHPRSVAYYLERGRVHVRNGRPEAVIIGPQLGRDHRATPTAMLTEACWLAVAFGARGVTHWGQQCVFDLEGDGYAPGGEAAWSALRRLRDEVYDPMESLLLKWEPTPRRMAMLVSRADALFDSGRRWQRGPEAAENMYRALLSLGEPTDVIYDAEVLDGVLADYEVLVVPSLYVANRSLVEAIARFAADGGVVISHADSVLADRSNVHVLAEDLSPRYRDYWIREGEASLEPHEYAAFLNGLASQIEPLLPFEPRVRKSSPFAITNLMTDGEQTYLVLVNDKRTYGPEVEALGHRFMLDAGEPLTVRVAVAGVEQYVLLDGDAPLPVDASGMVHVELQPGWGQVLRLVESKVTE